MKPAFLWLLLGFLAFTAAADGDYSTAAQGGGAGLMLTALGILAYVSVADIEWRLCSNYHAAITLGMAALSQ